MKLMKLEKLNMKFKIKSNYKIFWKVFYVKNRKIKYLYYKYWKNRYLIFLKKKKINFTIKEIKYKEFCKLINSNNMILLYKK